MTSMLALLAASAALLVTGTLGATMVRARRTSDKRLAAGLASIGARMDELSRELAQTVAKARVDAVRARIVESLGQALDLDEVLARSAEAAASLPGVAAATVEIDIEGDRFVASAGVDVAAPAVVSGPANRSLVRAVGISYHYANGSPTKETIHSAIAVPIASERRQLGFLTVFGRSEEPPVAGAEFQTLEAIARQSAPAIERARSRQAGGRLPETDGLTGLGNRQLFHETLALEVARAHRQGRRLSLCVLDVDDFKRTNSTVGHLRGDGLLVGVADLLKEMIRPVEIACRTGGDEFAVILPESGRIEAEALFARLQATLGRRPADTAPALSLSAGIAEVKPDDDGVSLYERAERALHRAKAAGRGTAA